MARTIQELIFENPGQVNATLTVNITWFPTTFNTKTFGNFSFNLWLLRKDSKKNAQITNYSPILLAQDHNVFDNGILWTPSMNDVDTNVPQAGTHQITWEKTDNNPFANAGSTSFNGFSQAFHVLSPDDRSLFSSSSAPSTTSETSTASSTRSSTTSISTSTGATDTLLVIVTATSNSSPQSTSLPSGTASAIASSHSIAIGLGVGLGILVMSLLIGAVFLVIYHRKQKTKEKALTIPMETPSEMPPPQYIYAKSPNFEPVEMDAARRTVELRTTRRTMELGMGPDMYPGYRI